MQNFSCIHIFSCISRQENHEALRYYQRADKPHPSDKLDAKISKLIRALDIREDGNPAANSSLGSSIGSTISNLGLSSDNRRPGPHTPIKHEEKRRSPGLESWQPDHPSGHKDTAMDSGGSEDKENTNPAVNVDPVTKPNTLVVSPPLTEGQKRGYNSYVLTAKQMLSRQENHEAVRYYQRADKLHPSHKLDAKISKLIRALEIKKESKKAK